MNMDIIEVDPKLFVTCRLCLEDLGQFQIVPSVAQQIKYCFDFNVEPFDGLPQLICLKCKEVLNKFHSVKTTFCDKQAKLKNRVLKKEEISISQHNTVSSSQQNDHKSSENIAEIITSKPKNKRVIQSSSSDEAEQEKTPKTRTKKRKVLSRNKVMEWEKDYKKEIVCKICNSHWQKKKSYNNHFHSHDALISKFKNVFIKPCSVILEKIDGKPNVTGESNIVMLSRNQIVKLGDMRFHTVYSRDVIVDENPKEKNIESKSSDETNLSQHDDDIDDDIVAKPKSKSLRLLSRSSNDTVVLENYDKNTTSDNDYDSITALECSDERPVASNDVCINIDDSESDSNSGNFDSRQRIKQPMEAKFGDYKIIQGIISMCVNSYQKKNEVSDIDTYINVMRNKKEKAQVSNESQLKHKLLSIGRKIINKQGFNCTGLLRFMEHKNLEILWITKSLPLKSNKDTNYIRILTKLRENETPDDSGWKYISENTVLDDNIPGKNIRIDDCSNIPNGKISVQDTKTSEKNKLNEPKNIEEIQQNLLNKQTEEENLPAVLYFNNNNNASSLPKKLLNANPVANPKLLPKKSAQTNERTSRPSGANQNVSHGDSEDSNFCMPIITSTTSLATSTTEEQKEDKSVTPGVVPSLDTPAPRIKVKPASELMSERMLNSIRNEKTASTSVSNILSSPNVWPYQQPINIFVPNMSPQPIISNQPLQLVQIPCMPLPPPPYQETAPNQTSNCPPPPYLETAPNQTSNCQRDEVILDTIEFPNTKTESPFKYFKDLLQVHNLVLLHPCDILSRDYYCLIKFKVLFKKETNKDNPVVLCLSLFCLKNNFCLKIRDGNQQNIDIDKISANWQWEILQIYRGEVVNKIIQNAQRISHELCAYTTNFFCLLKSINCKKI